jgi:hypothetical protein
MKRTNQTDKILSVADFLILQADGEVPELMRYFHSKDARDKNITIGQQDYFKNAFGIDTNNTDIFWAKLMWTSKCSAFIKITQENGKWKDILAGHTTWTGYSELLRSYKQ